MRAWAIALFIFIASFSATLVGELGIFEGVSSYSYIKITDYSLFDDPNRFSDETSGVNPTKTAGVLDTVEDIFQMAAFFFTGLTMVIGMFINSIAFPLQLVQPPFNLPVVIATLISGVVYIIYLVGIGELLVGRTWGA